MAPLSGSVFFQTVFFPSVLSQNIFFKVYFSQVHFCELLQGLATQCKAKTNFHFFLVGILPYSILLVDKIPTKKSESWF